MSEETVRKAGDAVQSIVENDGVFVLFVIENMHNHYARFRFVSNLELPDMVAAMKDFIADYEGLDAAAPAAVQ